MTDSEKHHVIFSIAFTPDELHQLQAAAEVHGTLITTMIRNLALEEARDPLGETFYDEVAGISNDYQIAKAHARAETSGLLDKMARTCMDDLKALLDEREGRS